MSNKQLIGPANRAFTSNGFPAPGATVSLYLSGTLTPANFYADDGLVTSLGPTLTANGAGRFETPAYQDEFTAFRIIYRDAAGVQLDDIDPFYFGYEGPRGPQGIQGDVSKVLTRTALAAIAVGGQAYGLVRYLVESGYEGAFIWNPADLSANVADDPGQFDYVPPGSGQGLATDGSDGAWVRANVVSIKTRDQLAAMPKSGVFVFDGNSWTFDTSDLSAMITADTAQGVYVAPSSDTTGASGAWVRQFTGAHNVKWFGAVGDNATNDGSAFLAALSYLKATYVYAIGFAHGAGRLFVPKGEYYLGTTAIDIHAGMIFEGESTWMGGATVLRWDAGTSGIRVHANNTDGASGVAAIGSAFGTIVRNFSLFGGYASSNDGDYYGIHLRGAAVVEDVYIERFQGEGVYATTTIGGGGALEGAASLSHLTRVYAVQCRSGFVFGGADANACTLISCRADANRNYGFYDDSFLGNYYFGCHTNGNTVAPYYVPATNLSNATTFDSCYAEGGQPTSQGAPKTLWLGGLHAPGITGGGILQATADGLVCRDIDAQGNVTAQSLTISPTLYNGTTQTTDKSTAVTLNAPAGIIIMNNANLATGATVGFNLSNTYIKSRYAIIIVHVSDGASQKSYNAWVDTVAGGVCHISLKNISAGDLAEAVQLSFLVVNAN